MGPVMPLKYSIFLFFLICFGVVNLLLLPRGPWMDEAMLLQNLDGMDFSGLFKPFPLYDQAAPPGQTMVALGISSVFGAEALYSGLRVSSLFAIASIALLILRTFRDDEKPHFSYIFLCLLLSCSTLTMQAATIKHYVLDALVASALLVAGVGVRRRGKALDWAIFIITALMGFLLSFISIVAVTAVIVALVWDNAKQSDAIQSKTILKHALVLTVLAIVFLGYKWAWIDTITYYQLAAYPEVYEKHIGGTGGVLSSLQVAWNLLHFAVSNLLFDTIEVSPSFWATRAIPLAGFVILLRFGLKAGGETGFVARVAICALAAVFALNITGKLPIPYERHFSFYQPIVLALGSLLIAAWSARLARPSILLILLGALAFDGVLYTLVKRFDDVPAAASFLASEENPAPDTAIWLSFPAQPAFLYDGRNADRLLGLFDPASGVPSWTIRGGGRMFDHEEEEVVISEDYPDQMLADIAGERQVWLVISHHWQLYDPTPFIVAAASDGWECDDNEKQVFSGVHLFFCRK